MMETRIRTRRIFLTSGPRALETLRQELHQALALDVRFPEARALTQLVVESTVRNILQEGYEGLPGHPVSVEVRSRGPESFAVIIRDRTHGLDLERILPGELAPSSTGQDHILVSSLTRDLKLSPRRGGGNELSLTFDPAALQAAVHDELGHAA